MAKYKVIFSISFGPLSIILIHKVLFGCLLVGLVCENEITDTNFGTNEYFNYSIIDSLLISYSHISLSYIY